MNGVSAFASVKSAALLDKKVGIRFREIAKKLLEEAKVEQRGDSLVTNKDGVKSLARAWVTTKEKCLYPQGNHLARDSTREVHISC